MHYRINNFVCTEMIEARSLRPYWGLLSGTHFLKNYIHLQNAQRKAAQRAAVCLFRDLPRRLILWCTAAATRVLHSHEFLTPVSALQPAWQNDMWPLVMGVSAPPPGPGHGYLDLRCGRITLWSYTPSQHQLLAFCNEQTC
jgi:hypothetical protein